MPTSLKTTIRFFLTGLLRDTGSGAKSELDYRYRFPLTNGAGANQADKVFRETRTIAPSGNFDYDLAGALLDAFGQPLSFARVKSIMVKAASGNANNVVLGNGGGNSFVGPFGAAAHTFAVKPNGLFFNAAHDAVGWPVVAGTGDIFRVANGGAGTPVTFDIVIVGSAT